ncbi:phosphate ABC transporter ATP-binding protein [Campylobacter canadensis]|uniref:Phosphate ABC transporter ATP-binding protein n=1 Tax=Campylobacter canadensis TaxID=449520 RepID=A0ABS7WR40_9BACT|nr:phosphate ABC transporter ATP-binding protein [Campylobacter canadensis]MBZ7986841.1 phosphate ABC transporter ATP-binding protein [Campylobacter canadensis]MBZ7997878.1 phosphate ABC transporter ATP-binding protein [Campylobacter canadensis]
MNIFEVKNLQLFYKNYLALDNINIDLQQGLMHALIGPSGCGKSSFLSTLNKMVLLNDDVLINAQIKYKNIDIYKDYDDTLLRKEVALIFQKPCVFAMSVYDNIAYALRVFGIKNKSLLDELVINALKKAALFDELKDRLKQNALLLSGGQQQRLCIARALACEPSVILFDEPTSALDPISSAKIEELILNLKKEKTIIIVTHNMQQAKRISDKTAFFLNKQIVEYDDSNIIFNNAKDIRTKDYVNGKFG